MNRKFRNKMTNAIDPARPASVWGYTGVPGKGGRSLNATIPEKKTDNKKESDQS